MADTTFTNYNTVITAAWANDVNKFVYGNYTASLPINQAKRSQFFTQNNARINRLTDRVLMGDAADNDGAYPNVTKDWMSTYQVAAGLPTGSVVSSQTAVLANGEPSAGIAFTSGSRSLNFTSAGTNSIGVFGYVLNNNATLATNAYAGYFEANHVTSAVNASYGIEVDTRTTVTTLTPTPYSQGNVVAVQIASGAGLSGTGQSDASCAIGIQSNPKKFKTGIVFGATSITGTDGVTGTGTAIAMAKGHILQWYNSSGQPTSSIYSDVSTAANTTSLVMNNSGFLVTANSNASICLSTGAVTSSVNWLHLSPNIAGNPVLLVAQGSDTNVGITLQPKGTATVNILGLQNFANDAAAATGGIAINGLYRNGSVLMVRVA